MEIQVGEAAGALIILWCWGEWVVSDLVGEEGHL